MFIFTKELPDQTSVDLALWDLILKSEQQQGSMCKSDKKIIDNLLIFFEKQDISLYNISKLFDILNKLYKESNTELSFQLLQAVREFENFKLENNNE